MQDNTQLTFRESAGTIAEVMPSLPEQNLLFICQTPSQINHWYQEKSFYTDLNNILTHFSIGKVAPKKSNQDYQDCLESAADMLISFYELLHCGWEFIEIDSKLVNLDLKRFQVSSPGEAIQMIVRNDSAHAFFQSFSHHLEFSPQKAHRRSKQFLKAYEEIAKDINCIKVINDTTNKQAGIEHSPELKYFYLFCFNVLEKHKDKNTRIKKKYMNYLREIIYSIELLKRQTHYRKPIRGFVQVDGIKKQR
jgi:flagellin-specific chaperone FliS